MSQLHDPTSNADITYRAKIKSSLSLSLDEKEIHRLKDNFEVFFSLQQANTFDYINMNNLLKVYNFAFQE